jgi:acyl-CoA thioester hydrolase
LIKHGEEQEAGSLISGWLTASGHAYQARIYYADTDFSGFVYHARYLEFLERGRSDYLRLAGISHTDMMDKAEDASRHEKLAWVVRHMDITFEKPARMDDIITVETATLEISGVRIRMTQMIKRGADRLISATVEAAIVTLEGKPRRFPKTWATLLRPRQT